MSREPSLKILIADADPSLKSALRLFLGRDGADVLDAEDGERALLIARTVPLDLLLADVTLPKLDGLELLRALRADTAPRVRALPVVIVAENASPELAARARTLGGTELLQKPISSQGIAALLRRAQRRRASGSGASWSSVKIAVSEEQAESAADPSGLKRGA